MSVCQLRTHRKECFLPLRRAHVHARSRILLSRCLGLSLYLWLCFESERNTVCECVHVCPVLSVEQLTPCLMIMIMMMTMMAKAGLNWLDKGDFLPGISNRLPGSSELCSLVQLLLFIYRQQWVWIASTTTTSHLSLFVFYSFSPTINTPFLLHCSCPPYPQSPHMLVWAVSPHVAL